MSKHNGAARDAVGIDLAHLRLVERAAFRAGSPVSLVAPTDSLHLFQGDRMAPSRSVCTVTRLLDLMGQRVSVEPQRMTRQFDLPVLAAALKFPQRHVIICLSDTNSLGRLLPQDRCQKPSITHCTFLQLYAERASIGAQRNIG